MEPIPHRNNRKMISESHPKKIQRSRQKKNEVGPNVDKPKPKQVPSRIRKSREKEEGPLAGMQEEKD